MNLLLLGPKIIITAAAAAASRLSSTGGYCACVCFPAPQAGDVVADGEFLPRQGLAKGIGQAPRQLRNETMHEPRSGLLYIPNPVSYLCEALYRAAVQVGAIRQVANILIALYLRGPYRRGATAAATACSNHHLMTDMDKWGQCSDGLPAPPAPTHTRTIWTDRKRE